MELIVPILAQLALLVGGWKLWRWSKKRQKASRTQWRRRLASLFFVSPMALWLISKFIPDNPVMDSVLYLSNQLDAGVDWVIGTVQDAARENAGGFGAFAIKPVVRSVVYALLGAIVGWPLDRRAAKKRAAEEAAAAGEGTGEQD